MLWIIYGFKCKCCTLASVMHGDLIVSAECYVKRKVKYLLLMIAYAKFYMAVKLNKLLWALIWKI